MKCISLWQPWATLIAIGAKQIETRGWPTQHRGPLAIHAAKRWTWEQGETITKDGPIHDALKAAGCLTFSDDEMKLVIPVGVIVAVADLTGCVQTMGGWMRGHLVDGTTVDAPEFHFGDYSPGRYAWKLANVRRLDVPVPFRGAQGFFNVPDSLLTSVMSPADAGLFAR